jgi:NitT/TauT family transport system substrate-binding protein
MRYALAIFSIIMLASCMKQEAMLSPDEKAQRDSSALQVAVMPVLSCLPVYYAQRTGLADSAGLNIRLHYFQAQMDIDTAIIRNHVDIAPSDLIRALRLWSDTTQVRAFMAVDEPVSLMALKGKRVSKVHQLKEKMVAIARLSITDYWCDQMVDSTEVSHADFYRPQVNDVRLRTEMLRTGLMDAAILPEPYASWMRNEGHVALKQTDEQSPRLAAWVVNGHLAGDSSKALQLKTFRQVYDSAAEQISSGVNVDTIRSILVQDFNIPAQALDSISLPQINPAMPLRKTDAEIAAKWLRSRSRLPKAAKQDSLFLKDEP